MSDKMSFDNALDEWSTLVRPRVRPAIKTHLFFYDETRPSLFEYRDLEDQLRRASLQEVAAMPVNTFGAIGDDIPMLKPEAFLWLLPVLLQFGSRSAEPIYASSVIDRFLQEIAPMSVWPQIQRELSRRTVDCMHEYAKQCCRLGWEGTTERRVQERLNACEEVFH